VIEDTNVLAPRLDESSAEVRGAPPREVDDDVERPIWTGVIPLRRVAAKPLSEERVPDGIAVHAYASDYRRPAAAADVTDA
jgi:uncharacterized protein